MTSDGPHHRTALLLTAVLLWQYIFMTILIVNTCYVMFFSKH